MLTFRGKIWHREHTPRETKIVEMAFDCGGHPLIGDENAPDFTDLALENLEWDEDVPVQEFRALWGDNAPWVDVDELSAEDCLDETYASRAEKTGYPNEKKDEEEAIVAALAECVADEAENWLKAYDERGEAKNAIRRHPLVREYGFGANSLLAPDGNPFGVETLAVLLAGAKAARELGRAASCKAMGIEDKGRTLASMGIKALFRAAPALQAALARKEAAKPKPIRLGVSLVVPSAPAAPQRPPVRRRETPHLEFRR